MSRYMLTTKLCADLTVWEIDQKTELLCRIWGGFDNKQITFVKPNEQHCPPHLSNNKFYFATCYLSNLTNSYYCTGAECIESLNYKGLL